MKANYNGSTHVPQVDEMKPILFTSADRRIALPGPEARLRWESGGPDAVTPGDSYGVDSAVSIFTVVIAWPT